GRAQRHLPRQQPRLRHCGRSAGAFLAERRIRPERARQGQAYRRRHAQDRPPLRPGLPVRQRPRNDDRHQLPGWRHRRRHLPPCLRERPGDRDQRRPQRSGQVPLPAGDQRRADRPRHEHPGQGVRRRDVRPDPRAGWLRRNRSGQADALRCCLVDRIYCPAPTTSFEELKMIVRTLAECEQSNRKIVTETWDSTRMLLKDDNMGFSFHITTIYANTETHIHYQNHLESVYCISGNGEIETIADGKIYKIEAGTLYILDKHDEHLLRGGSEDMKMACVFNPPLNGKEVHDESGVYPLEAETVA